MLQNLDLMVLFVYYFFFFFQTAKIVHDGDCKRKCGTNLDSGATIIDIITER